MKTKTYLFILMMAVAPMLRAQITVTVPNASIFVQKDSFTGIENFSNYSGYGKAMTNAKWDFTKATYPTNRFTFERLPANSTNYSDASFVKSQYYPFAGELRYDVRTYVKVGTSDLGGIGEEIVEDQVLSIQALTGNANDQLVFPKQSIPFDNTDLQIKYPATMGDNWTSTTTKNTKFNLTVTAYGLNNTPGVRKSVRTVKDTVVGWGTVDLFNRYTLDTVRNIPVLQVHHTVSTKDSFFLGGQPAPAALLSAFGLAQGRVYTFNYVDLIREGEIDELARIEYGDNPYETPLRIYVHQSRLKSGSSNVGKLSLNNAIKSYPNPVNGNTISIDLPSNYSGDWSYQIIDFLGRPMLNGAIAANNRTGIIDLENRLSSGQYILQIAHNNKAVSNNIITVQP